MKVYLTPSYFITCFFYNDISIILNSNVSELCLKKIFLLSFEIDYLALDFLLLSFQLKKCRLWVSLCSNLSRDIL